MRPVSSAEIHPPSVLRVPETAAPAPPSGRLSVCVRRSPLRLPAPPQETHPSCPAAPRRHTAVRRRQARPQYGRRERADALPSATPRARGAPQTPPTPHTAQENGGHRVINRQMCERPRSTARSASGIFICRHRRSSSLLNARVYAQTYRRKGDAQCGTLRPPRFPARRRAPQENP